MSPPKKPIWIFKRALLTLSTQSSLTDALQTRNFPGQRVMKSQFLAGHLEVNHSWHRPILSALYNIENILEHTQHILATFLTEAF